MSEKGRIRQQLAARLGGGEGKMLSTGVPAGVFGDAGLRAEDDYVQLRVEQDQAAAAAAEAQAAAAPPSPRFDD